jgi:phosphoglycerate dehydrogenase-like enzyme
MTVRQILMSKSAHQRVAEQLTALGHDLDLLLWSPDGLTRPDGSIVETSEAAPEVAWISIDLFFDGHFPAFVDAVVASDSLKWVQACLAGTDAPPFAKIVDAGARLSNSDAPNVGVAEYVMSSILHVVHGVGDRIASQHAGRWVQSGWPEIGTMTWVMIGFGSIGSEVAKRARPFGVEVVGVRRTKVQDERADRMAIMDDLFDELPEADAVIIACPLTDDTRGLVGAEFLSKMKPGSILVNVARGPIVDTEALLSALDSGTPAKAILDVFDVEPLPEDSPLWTHPSVVMTSHIAGAGTGGGPRGDVLFLEQLDNYLHTRPLRLEVTR